MKKYLLVLLCICSVMYADTHKNIGKNDKYMQSHSNHQIPSKPYYALAHESIEEVMRLGFYNKWVPMYLSKAPSPSSYKKTTISQLDEERKKVLNDIYLNTDVIAILKVTHFYIYRAPSNESGYNVKFRANVIKVVKGTYTKKTIVFDGDYDNAPDAESYDQMYLLHRSEDPVGYQSDEFMQFDPVGVELDYFLNKQKRKKK